MERELTRLVVAHNKLAERKVPDHLEDVIQLLANASPEVFETFCDLIRKEGDPREDG